MGYPRAGGKQIHEKNQKHKNSWHCPFRWLDLDLDLGDLIRIHNIGIHLWSYVQVVTGI